MQSLTIFIARQHACRARYCFTVSVCLTSVQCRYCVQTSAYIVTLFDASSGGLILVLFCAQPLLKNSVPTFYMRANDTRNSHLTTNFCMVTKLDANFKGVTTPPTLANFFYTNADAQSVCSS